jgi:hypothetical protein
MPKCIPYLDEVKPYITGIEGFNQEFNYILKCSCGKWEMKSDFRPSSETTESLKDLSFHLGETIEYSDVRKLEIKRFAQKKS